MGVLSGPGNRNAIGSFNDIAKVNIAYLMYLIFSTFVCGCRKVNLGLKQ